jgi:hypothetical protein
LVLQQFFQYWVCKSMSMGCTSHLLMSSSNSFFSDLLFLLYRSFTSFIKCLPSYFKFLVLLWMVFFCWFLSQSVGV